MFQVTIILNNTDANFALSYKTKADAEKAKMFILNKLVENKPVPFEHKDDFGYVAILRASDISYCIFVDVEKSQLCQFELDITKRHAEQQMIERLNSDPETKKLFPAAPMNGMQPPKRSTIIQ